MITDEYGGYLPLELNIKHEYYDKYSNNVCSLNNGRNAILASLIDSGIKTIYIPFYNCEYVKKTLDENGINIIQYYIDEKYEPRLDYIPDNSSILIVNYFGIMPRKQMSSLIKKYKRVIFDNTQAFFQKPFLYENVYNIYSCRKFIGVSDGAYLIHKGGVDKKYKVDKSSECSKYLINCIESGTNANYNLYLQSERILSNKSILM